MTVRGLFACVWAGVLSEVGKVRRQGLVGAAVNRDVGLGCVHVFILEEKLEIWVFVAYTRWRLISLKKKKSARESNKTHSQAIFELQATIFAHLWFSSSCHVHLLFVSRQTP